MMRMPSTFFAALMLLPLCLAGCGKTAPAPATAPGTAASATAGPRLVSTGPALTLISLQVGAGDFLVGVSSLDKELLPEAKQNLPVVGDYNTINYELLDKLAPTAILVQKSEKQLASLRTYCAEHHIELINARLDTLADIYATARRIAQAAGMPEAAEKQIALSELRIARLKQRVAGAPRPRVLYITGNNPVFVVGGERFMNEMLEMAGAENLGAKIGNDFPNVTREQILQLKPDVILVADPGGMPQKADDPRIKTWADLPTPAAADGRIYVVTDGEGLLGSLNIAERAKVLAKLLHPKIDFDAPLPDAAPQPAGGKP